MTTNDSVFSVVLHGLDSTNSITVTPYTSTIPIREIYGTIAEARFSDMLGAGFYEPGKKYGVREICAYPDNKGEVWRFHIVIFDERQYRLMKSLLMKRIHHDAIKLPEPTGVCAVRTAVAVHVASRRWLSFLRSRDYRM